MAQTLGNWKLVAPIGRGGQGHVFKARRTESVTDTELFALKRLANVGTAKARARFAREIEALKRIMHTGIVQPVDYAQPDEPVPYYVMPYEEGVRPLSEHIWPTHGTSTFTRNPLACLKFIAKCAEAIANAHLAKVIHRDLKPDNILVRADGSPLIIDFGCCLLLGDEGLLTLTDEGVGGRNYLAPECESGIEGESSPRSDVYSLGKVLWSMISGERAFAREKPGFANKLVTTIVPDNPFAGFIVEAMLRSVRADPSHRSETATEWAQHCSGFADRIRAGAGHVSYVAPRCVACKSTNVKMSNGRISGPMSLDASVFIGNEANNPNLAAKFCFDCGSVTLHDSRPHDEYGRRLSEAGS